MSEEELKQWIKVVQRKHVYDSVQRQWSDFDTDNNGLISWDEYKNVTYGSYLGKMLKLNQQSSQSRMQSSGSWTFMLLQFLIILTSTVEKHSHLVFAILKPNSNNRCFGVFS